MSQVNITLYDISTTLPVRTFSPFVVRARIVLSLKKLPFTIHWLNRSEVEPTAKSIGAPPSGLNADGGGRYTVPFIKIEHADSSKPPVALCGSDSIIHYLEETYPIDGQPLFPAQDRIFHSVFIAYVNEKFSPHSFIANIPYIVGAVTPDEADCFYKSRSALLGEPASLPSEEVRAASAIAYRAFFAELAEHFDKAGKGNNRLSNGAFTYAEILLVSFIKSAQQVNGHAWQILQEVAGGRFARLLDLPEYSV